jgi:hypothetical protein
MVGILTRRVLERAAFAANGSAPQPGELTPVSDVSWVTTFPSCNLAFFESICQMAPKALLIRKL